MNKEKHARPVGIIILLIFIGYYVLAALIAMPKSQFIIGFYRITGMGALTHHFFLILLYASIFYGVMKRKGWSRKLLIGLQFYAIGLVVTNIISLLLFPQQTIDAYFQFFQSSLIQSTVKNNPYLFHTMIFGDVLAIVTALVVMIYVWFKKEYFTN